MIDPIAAAIVRRARRTPEIPFGPPIPVPQEPIERDERAIARFRLAIEADDDDLIAIAQDGPWQGPICNAENSIGNEPQRLLRGHLPPEIRLLVADRVLGAHASLLHAFMALTHRSRAIRQGAVPTPFPPDLAAKTIEGELWNIVIPDFCGDLTSQDLDVEFPARYVMPTAVPRIIWGGVEGSCDRKATVAALVERRRSAIDVGRGVMAIPPSRIHAMRSLARRRELREIPNGFGEWTIGIMQECNAWFSRIVTAHGA